MGSLSDFLVDTVAFVRYLEDRLPPKSDRVFRDAETGRSHLLLPQIALAEFLDVALRGRLKSTHPALQSREVLDNLLASSAFTVAPMSSVAWEVFLRLEIAEMHDRMIASEALARRIPLITNDPAFDGVPQLRTIW
jgi:predicted nucleic acid-binding protein